MKKYSIMFEDPENGLKVPILVTVSGKDIFDAIEQFEKELTLADRMSEEGLEVIREAV